ncbi:5343_t:CDS:2 [Paraglomus occultum]|uniref:5343_t:CDS:1 n=1 Tax=Paraglomus occultum TaxID=144539 RepID=A0A9N9C0R6_9GLOM|nr:5343_t:CDS:2 [Paraglomus occultum]
MSPEDVTTEDSFETDQNYLGDCERDPLLGGHAPPKKKFRLKTIARALLLTLFVAFVIVLVAVFHIQDHIKDVLKYIEQHKEYGILVYLAVYVACTWLFLPGSVMSIAAGFLFKPAPLAAGIIILGDIISALGTFLFGRYIFSDWVRAQVAKRPVFNALNYVIADEGWKIVVMLRLTPIPFNIISYFFSVSSIDLFSFLWATALGVLPGTFNAVWIGTLVKNLSGIDKPKLQRQDIVIIAMNFILASCGVIALSMIGKRSMRRAMAMLEASKELQPGTNEDAVVDIEPPGKNMFGIWIVQLEQTC